MVYYTVSAIVVEDIKLFNRTGMVGRWAENIKNEAVAFSTLEAPDGNASGRTAKSRWTYTHIGPYPPGSMKRSISGEVLRVGPRQLNTKIVVDVPYALYVIKGTGTIFSKSARSTTGQFTEIGSEGRGESSRGGMYLPANAKGKATVRQRVRGQRANNFLGRAMATTARKHSSLRGFRAV
jgi:hypothetical protein